MYLDKLLDHIEKESLKKSKIHAERKDENKFYVNDLFKCRKKVKEVTVEQKSKVSTASPVLIGNLVEKSLDYKMKKLGFWTQSHDNDKLKMTREVGDYLISGRLDYYHPRDNIAIELKVPIYPKKKPREHYKAQCGAYDWLSNSDGNVNIQSIYLWQLSSQDLIETEIGKTYTTQKIRDIIDCPFYPRWEWECKYCDLADECEIKNGELGNIDLS